MVCILSKTYSEDVDLLGVSSNGQTSWYLTVRTVNSKRDTFPVPVDTSPHVSNGVSGMSIGTVSPTEHHLSGSFDFKVKRLSIIMMSL